MGYATIADVEARDTVRPHYTARTKPTVTEVEAFLEDTAATLDGVLRAGGFQLPIDAGATLAQRWLRQANAVGAYALVQAASTPDRDEPSNNAADQAWQAMIDMLRLGRVELDIPHEGGGIAYAKVNADPFWEPAFTRDMEF